MSSECPSSTSEDKQLPPRGLEHGGRSAVRRGGSSFIRPDLQPPPSLKMSSEQEARVSPGRKADRGGQQEADSAVSLGRQLL